MMPDSITILLALSTFLSLVMTAILYQRYNHLKKQEDESCRRIVEVLDIALQAKDKGTHDHAHRTQVLAHRIGKAMGMAPGELRCLEYAAELHDIGKIGIEDSILKKPAKFTPSEYEIMKKHTNIGAQILAPLKWAGPVIDIVLHHQEWFNGKGYPDGLSGESIPLGARIVAVIDAWDAMASNRVYRQAMPREESIRELRQGTGTQFDPRVVEVFLKTIDAFHLHDFDTNHKGPAASPAETPLRLPTSR